MRDANRQNDKLIVPDLVHDAVVPNTEPSQAPQVAFQHGAEERSFRQPVDGDGKIVEDFEIVLGGEADDVGPAASELLRSRVQRIDQRVGQSRGHLLGHGGFSLALK